MRAATVEISSKNIRQSSFPLSTKNAWAKYVRNRWPQNTLCMAQAEWNLTEGEARGLLYAQASQPTIDKILDTENRKSPLGAFRLGLTILEIRTATKLESFIVQQAEEAARERIQWEQEERRLALLQARVSGLRCLDGPADQPPGVRGLADQGVGAEPDARAVAEPRSFEPRGRG
jgi:hypothetical protein